MTLAGHMRIKRAASVAGLMVLVGLLWDVVESLPTLLSRGYSPYQTVWMRYGTHIIFMLLFLAPRHGWSLVRTRRPALQVGRGLLMLVMPISFISSLGHARANDILSVFWLSPLLILIFAALVQGDRARWLLWVAALIAMIGAQMIMRPSAEVVHAVPFGIGMAVSFSLYVVLTRSLRDEPTMVNLFYSAIVVFIPLTLVMPAIWKPLTLRDALVMMGVGLAGLALLWALDKACELVSPNLIASLFALQLVFYLLLVPLMEGMWPGKLALGGVTLISTAALTTLFFSGEMKLSSHESIEVEIKVGLP